MSVSRRLRLLSGAAAVGVALAAAPASAENRVQYFGSLEGAFLFSAVGDVNGAYTYDNSGFDGSYRDFAETDIGWGARLELGMKVDEWTFAFGGLVQKTYGDDRTDDTSGDGDNYSFDNTATYWAIDFEVGQEYGLGGGSTINPFVGVRYAEVKFQQDGSVLYSGGAGFGTYDLNSKAWGLGPQIGLKAHVPLFGDFSLDAEAAGFVLFGQLEREDSSSFCGGGCGPYSQDQHETFWGAEAELGLSWNFSLSPTTEGALTIGYRVDWIDDAVQGEQTLYDSNLSNPAFRFGSEEDYLSHGPAISFSFRN